MPEPQEQTAGADVSGGDTTSDQIARSLGSVCQRFSELRPKSTTAEIERALGRSVIEEDSPDPGAEEGAEAPAEPGLSADSASFNSNATAAISRVPGRRVIAFIPKHDK